MQSVKIVAATEPKILTDREAMSIDEFVAYVARVSNPSNQMNTATAPKLLKYLAKHKHWSPFEMVDIVMEIETTRDIGRQILRHRSFRFQEFSQRYADPTRDMGFVTREARLQDTKNRQNSIEVEDSILQNDWQIYQSQVIEAGRAAYEWAVESGIAKEQARAVLPEGLILSRMYMAGSLRSWIHYCQVRMDPSTQKEHREIAQMAWGEIIKIFPSLSEVIADS
jgi:thymidylate synthase (FAD)